MKKKFVFGFFKGLAFLPLPILYLISDFITFFLHRIIGYRKKVVRQNLTSSFPDKNIKEIKRIERGFYRFLGSQIVETIKTLNLSDKELQGRVTVKNYEAVNEAMGNGRNAVLLMGHYGNWEWVQEITRYFLPEVYMASIYHPLSDKVMDEIFIKLRSRWGAHIVPMKQAPRVLLNRDNMPWVCGFIADAWTWNKKEDNKVEFLNHDTWFITGPEEIGAKLNAEFFYLKMTVIKRGHYEISFHKLSPLSPNLPYPYTRRFWLEFEKTICHAPQYWLWSHKRWK